MAHSFACLHHHLIFSTKNRVAAISVDLQPRLLEYIGGILRAERCCLVAAGGMPDHVHLLVAFGREMSAAEAVRLIKTNSSKWVHETFPAMAEFGWQNGYGAFAVSYSHLRLVKRYLARQEEHHRTRTFQEEFRDFLERHHIAYDERYVWE
jgi:REP element-mobilizing transposase RayT